jgi:hypothetical protein
MIKVGRFLVICMIIVAFATSIASAQTIQRAISDFVNAQDKYPGIWEFWYAYRTSLPGCPGGASGPYPAGFVDYAGYWTTYLASYGISLGTTMSGAVHQKDNGDGTSTVSVQLDTTNAIAWASCYPPIDTVYLGNWPQDVATGKPAALGASHMSVVFTIVGTGPTAPLPSITAISAICPAPAPCFVSLKFTATATGLLGSPYGSLEGTPGMMSIEQIGTFHKTGRAGYDGYTAEFVRVQPAQ